MRAEDVRDEAAGEKGAIAYIEVGQLCCYWDAGKGFVGEIRIGCIEHLEFWELGKQFFKYAAWQSDASLQVKLSNRA